MKKIALIFVILMITACASTTGQVIEIKDASAFIKGETTYDEVVKKFGEPSSININSDGTRTIIYSHTDTQTNPANYIIPTIGGVASAVIPIAGLVTNMIPSGGNSTTETTNAILTFDQKLILIDYTLSQSKM